MKATEKDKFRCKMCYGILTNPFCDLCEKTRANAGRILRAAHEIFRLRGSVLERPESVAPVIL